MAYPGSFDHQSNVNPTQLTRPGALNGGSDPRALYLKLFSGEMSKGEKARFNRTKTSSKRINYNHSRRKKTVRSSRKKK